MKQVRQHQTKRDGLCCCVTGQLQEQPEASVSLVCLLCVTLLSVLFVQFQEAKRGIGVSLTTATLKTHPYNKSVILYIEGDFTKSELVTHPGQRSTSSQTMSHDAGKHQESATVSTKGLQMCHHQRYYL